MSPTRGVRLPLSHTLGHPLSLLQPERRSGAGPRHSGSHFVFGTGSGRDKTLPEHEHWGPRRPGGTRGTQERVCSLSTSTCSTSAGASGPPPSSCQIAAPASVTQQDMCPAKLTHTSQRLGRVRVPWGSHGNSGTGRTRERAWEGGFGGHMGWAGQGTEASQATPAAATGPASLTAILVWGLGTAGSSGGTGLSGLRTRAELCFGRSQD